MANIFYGFPSKDLAVIGVTGTDGKTTTVNMIYQILKDAGKKVSLVSTINAEIAGKSYDTGFHVTSPDPFVVQKLTKQALDHGDEYLILEVTSHGLDQFRFWGVKFKVGVITNITHEHLDYHRTKTSYIKTKLKLLKGVRVAIINCNLNQYVKRSGKLLAKIITFGLERGDVNQQDLRIKLQVPGDYNIENALAALATTTYLGVDQRRVVKSLLQFKGLTGRMEGVKNNNGLRIIIDFAHTPNGLEKALMALRTQTPSGKLITITGAEGQRDIKKRWMMGKIAQQLSDMVILTAVDPRGELKAINQQIKKGAKKAGAKEGVNFYIIDDRKKAIDFAINILAKKGDTVGIFGKGHEKSINLDGKKELPWSDRKACEDALKNG